MEKEAYGILGINQQQLGEGDADFAIRKNFRGKLSELLAKVNAILDAQKKWDGEKEVDYTNADKISDIDEEIQNMFSVLFAYMKIGTKEARHEYETGEVQTVKEDMKNMKENLSRSTRIEYRSRREGAQTLSNAYQILGVPEQENDLPDRKDKKVEIKAIMRIQMSAEKKLPYAIEEILSMLSALQGDVWAYSKINTLKNRSDYNEELSCQRARQESRICDNRVGTVRRETFQKPVSALIHTTDEGENFSIVNIGRLVNRALMLDEGMVNQYALERDFNGEKSRILFYGKIDIKRLETDPKYAEFWRKTLFSGNSIGMAKHYLGGYIGEAKTITSVVQGEKEESLILERKPFDVAICRRYQNDRTKERNAKMSGATPGEQPQGGETR